jgi:hypothetical protein
VVLEEGAKNISFPEPGAVTHGGFACASSACLMSKLKLFRMRNFFWMLLLSSRRQIAALLGVGCTSW